MTQDRQERFGSRNSVSKNVYCGVEQEYEVHDADGDTYHFKVLLNRHKDRLDHFEDATGKIHVDNGICVYADDAEAEIVTPPIDISPGVGADVAAATIRGRQTIETLLEEEEVKLRGYSTHVNVTDPDLEMPVGPYRGILTLLSQKPYSRGVRRRHKQSRSEITTEYVHSPEELSALVTVASAIRRAPPSRYSRVGRDHVNMTEEGRNTTVETGDESATLQEVAQANYRDLEDEISSLCTREEQERIEAYVYGDLELNVDRAENPYVSLCEDQTGMSATNIERLYGSFSTLSSRIDVASLGWESITWWAENRRQSMVGIDEIAEYADTLPVQSPEHLREALLSGEFRNGAGFFSNR